MIDLGLVKAFLSERLTITGKWSEIFVVKINVVNLLDRTLVIQ